MKIHITTDDGTLLDTITDPDATDEKLRTADETDAALAIISLATLAEEAVRNEGDALRRRTKK